MINTQPDICHISIGTKQDIETIAKFQVDMARESEGTTLNFSQVYNGVTAVMNDATKGTYLIARIDNMAVGSLMLTREWSDWNNRWYWWIQSVYVKPSCRSKGIYRAMYDKVKAMAGEQGVTQIRLYVDKNNLSAQTVYHKLGMQECHYLMYEEDIEL